MIAGLGWSSIVVVPLVWIRLTSENVSFHLGPKEPQIGGLGTHTDFRIAVSRVECSDGSPR